MNVFWSSLVTNKHVLHAETLMCLDWSVACFLLRCQKSYSDSQYVREGLAMQVNC